MKATRTAVVLLAVLTMLLSACAPSAAPAPAPAPQPTAPPQAAATPEAGAPAGAELSGDLVLWSMWNEGEPQQQVQADAIAAFQKAHPKVNVKVTWAGREVLTKSRTALLGGQQLDLIDQAADELNAALFKTDQVIPLDDLLEQNAYGESVKFKDVLLPGVTEPYKTNGKVVFIPYEIITSAFWYDENLFAANNITPPKTWDELMQACETLKGKNMPCFAQDNADFYNAYWFYWLAQRIMGPGAWYNAVADMSCKSWDDPGWLEVAKKEAEPIQKGYFMKGYEGNVWPAGQTAWAQGQAALLLCGSWIPSETQPLAKPDFKFRGMPFPEVAGGKGKNTEVESYLIGYVVPKAAKNPDAAKEFIKFVLTEPVQQDIVTRGKNAAARVGVTPPEVLPDMEEWFNTSTKLFKPYDGVQADFPSYWTTSFLALHDKFFHGEMSPEEFLTQVKAGCADYWSKPTPTPGAIR